MNLRPIYWTKGLLFLDLHTTSLSRLPNFSFMYAWFRTIAVITLQSDDDRGFAELLSISKTFAGLSSRQRSDVNITRLSWFKLLRSTHRKIFSKVNIEMSCVHGMELESSKQLWSHQLYCSGSLDQASQHTLPQAPFLASTTTTNWLVASSNTEELSCQPMVKIPEAYSTHLPSLLRSSRS